MAGENVWRTTIFSESSRCSRRALHCAAAAATVIVAESDGRVASRWDSMVWPHRTGACGAADTAGFRCTQAFGAAPTAVRRPAVARRGRGLGALSFVALAVLCFVYVEFWFFADAVDFFGTPCCGVRRFWSDDAVRSRLALARRGSALRRVRRRLVAVSLVRCVSFVALFRSVFFRFPGADGMRGRVRIYQQPAATTAFGAAAPSAFGAAVPTASGTGYN
jgi:hypothetical protein